MLVTSYSVTYCIYIPGKPVLADRDRLFVHYTISLSSLCKLIWRHWTYKMPVRYILSSVWVRLSIFSQLSIVHYMGLCVFSLPISLMMTEKIYTLSYNHHQIGSMNYYPLFRVRSWNNGMRCMSLYILLISRDIRWIDKFWTQYHSALLQRFLAFYLSLALLHDRFMRNIRDIVYDGSLQTNISRLNRHM